MWGVHVHLCVGVCVCLRLSPYVCMFVCARMCACTPVCVRLYVCECAYVCVSAHMHAHGLPTDSEVAVILTGWGIPRRPGSAQVITKLGAGGGQTAEMSSPQISLRSSGGCKRVQGDQQRARIWSRLLKGRKF